jgi:hypothetical protein
LRARVVVGNLPHPAPDHHPHHQRYRGLRQGWEERPRVRDGHGSRIQTSTTIAPSEIVTADFNGDGKLDVAVRSASASVLALWLGNNSGAFTDGGADRSFTGTLSYLVAAKLNGDAIVDLAAYTAGTSQIQLFAGNGDGTLAPATIVTGRTNTTGLYAGDLDNDGDTISSSGAPASPSG